ARYGLEGLLPPTVETLDRQVERVLTQLDAKTTDLERYIYFMSLADRNETLFFKTLSLDPAKYIPIVYDPTIAEALLTYSQIYRRARGMYLSRDMKGRFAEVLKAWPTPVDFICVTSGQRILGLGDIGANGMPIPIGKLQLYTACAGVPPEGLLPIMFDMGTTNAAMRADALYLGLREPPPPPEEVDALVDEFVAAVQTVFPGACIHFEDWKGVDAIRLLARYRNKVLCFNDDIQGTAAVTLAGLITALQIKDEPLTAQRFLFLGAGSAGIGIANMICSAMQQAGLSEADARARISLFDIHGLIEPSRSDLIDSQKVYAHQAPPSKDFLDVVRRFKPTVLIGVSTTPRTFTRQIVEAMSAMNKRPIIFALSNPTDKAECSAAEAYEWSGGKALFAGGVQFPDFEYEGRIYHPGQANNFYIYPALALAIYATKPKRVTDAMWIAAAQATADQVDQISRNRGMLYPRQDRILEVEVTTAARVAEAIFEAGEAGVDRPADIRAWLEPQLYKPSYSGALP
ncbi:MAG: NAD-dependent malic enzyme, partial [Hyphomicrobiales bacterium]|nr:NAD-dependent malic enzyme [Hyphomicrobiales bacterium]